MSEKQEPYIPLRCPGCIFCSEEISKRIIASHGSVFAIEDKYPVTRGHLLIIPYRHTSDYFSMTPEERQDADKLLRLLKSKILGEDKTVTGFNIGMNCGEIAVQTVMHAHIHLIPRREGDVEDPKGGIRHVIPGKGNY
ncbi:ATP adenylyltransferase [Patescibacteria group bacterium]|nr:ATP adenylyltransferase [Patescibacteria group bacterium]